MKRVLTVALNLILSCGGGYLVFLGLQPQFEGFNLGMLGVTALGLPFLFVGGYGFLKRKGLSEYSESVKPLLYVLLGGVVVILITLGILVALVSRGFGNLR